VRSRPSDETSILQSPMMCVCYSSLSRKLLALAVKDFDEG